MIKYYAENCPSCGTSMQRRFRDLGKDCTKCTMSKVGLAHAQKRRQNPTRKTTQEYSQKSRAKRLQENPFEFRLSRTLGACKNKAKKSGVPCDITLQDLIDMFPSDNLCPILGVPFVWGTKKNHELSPSVDRMIPELGYVKNNIRFISYKANRIKNNATIEILQNLINYMKA